MSLLLTAQCSAWALPSAAETAAGNVKSDSKTDGKIDNKIDNKIDSKGGKLSRTESQSDDVYYKSADGSKTEEKHAEKIEEKSEEKIEEKHAEKSEDKSSEDKHEFRIPKSGKVYSTRAQLKAASDEAVKIKEHDPGVKPHVSTHEQLHRPTVAMAFGGGGARGAAHIGVLKVLKESGIPVDYIVGTSMGSIVGGLYSAGVPLDDIEQMLEDKSLRRAYIGHVPPKILLAPLAKLIHPFGKNNYAGLWTGDKFEKFIASKLPDKDMLVTDTKIPFSVVATNLLDGQAYRISDGKLSTAIRASASISPIIKPIEIGDKLYCDGGVRANLPAGAARETGADVVIAVLADEPLKPMAKKKFKHITGIAMRLTDIVLAVSDERELEFADVVISPDVSHVPVLSKDPKDARRAELAGELAARKALPAILKKMEARKRFNDREDSVAASKASTVKAAE